MSKANSLPTLRGNIAALAAVQISNYVIPLIILPYLTRTLGAESFGKVAFAQIVMTYFVLLVDYGFSWSATRKVAAQRNNREAISRIFASTWAAQWLLVLISLIFAYLIVLSSDRLRIDGILYAAAFTTVIGTALFPVWLLQGLERLQVVAILQLLVRCLALVPILIVVKSPSDAIWVLIIQGTSAILGGILSIAWIHHKSIIAWKSPRWPDVLAELREGAPLFGSRTSISAYTTLIPLALGWIAGPVALAHFNLADKLRSAAQSLINPLSQALFPRMSNLVKNDRHAAYHLIRRSTVAVSIVAGASSLALWMLSNWLVKLLGGQEFLPAAAVLQWLSPLPLIVGLSNILGVQIMLPHGLNRSFNLSLLSAAGISLILVWPLIAKYSAIGAAQTILLVEIWVTATMLATLFNQGYLNPDHWRNS